MPTTAWLPAPPSVPMYVRPSQSTMSSMMTLETVVHWMEGIRCFGSVLDDGARMAAHWRADRLAPAAPVIRRTRRQRLSATNPGPVGHLHCGSGHRMAHQRLLDMNGRVGRRAEPLPAGLFHVLDLAPGPVKSTECLRGTGNQGLGHSHLLDGKAGAHQSPQSRLEKWQIRHQSGQ